MILNRTKKNPISPPFLYLVIQKTVLAAINSNFVVDIKCTVLVFLVVSYKTGGKINLVGRLSQWFLKKDEVFLKGPRSK